LLGGPGLFQFLLFVFDLLIEGFGQLVELPSLLVATRAKSEN
jgi:hypothetical protein